MLDTIKKKEGSTPISPTLVNTANSRQPPPVSEPPSPKASNFLEPTFSTSRELIWLVKIIPKALLAKIKLKTWGETL